MLAGLLSKIGDQATDGLFGYSVVVVDNDKTESARETVEFCARNLNVPITYVVEPGRMSKDGNSSGRADFL
jgi:hypothetical protein